MVSLDSLHTTVLTNEIVAARETVTSRAGLSKLGMIVDDTVLLYIKTAIHSLLWGAVFPKAKPPMKPTTAKTIFSVS